MSLTGCADGYSIQPGSDASSRTHVSSAPSKHQECGLKRIFCKMQVPCDPAANSEDQGTVASHQGSERLLVGLRDKTIQEPVIRWSCNGMICSGVLAKRGNDGS
jgi:hypothetical protein